MLNLRVLFLYIWDAHCICIVFQRFMFGRYSTKGQQLCDLGGQSTRPVHVVVLCVQLVVLPQLLTEDFKLGIYWWTSKDSQASWCKNWINNIAYCTIDGRKSRRWDGTRTCQWKQSVYHSRRSSAHCGFVCVSSCWLRCRENWRAFCITAIVQALRQPIKQAICRPQIESKSSISLEQFRTWSAKPD